MLGQGDRRLRARRPDMGIHIARVREPPADVFTATWTRNEFIRALISTVEGSESANAATVPAGKTSHRENEANRQESGVVT